MAQKQKELLWNIICLVFLGLAIIWAISAFYDEFYGKPVATDKANEYCQANGFDFYESFERVGMFSENPVAITCRYVEQYMQIDLNNQNPLVKVN